MKIENLSLLLTKAFHSKCQHLQLETTLELPFTALALSQLFHHSIDKACNLILTLNDKQSQDLAHLLAFFEPNIKAVILPSPEKTSQQETLQKRCAWLYAAQNPDSWQVFIAPIEALMQKAPSPSLFASHCLSIKKGDWLPEDLREFFTHRGYESCPLVEHPGQYSLRGNRVDFFSPSHSLPCRIELFGDQVEALWHFLPEKQRNWKALDVAHIIPCNPFFYSKENSPEESITWRQRGCKRIQESIRKKELHVGQIGKDLPYFLSCLGKGISFQGIEFLMDYFFSDLQSPLSFLKKPFNLWVLCREQLQKKAKAFVEELQEEKGAFLRRPDLFLDLQAVMELLNLDFSLDVNKAEAKAEAKVEAEAKIEGGAEVEAKAKVEAEAKPKEKFHRYIDIKPFHERDVESLHPEHLHISYPCVSLTQKFKILNEIPFASEAWTNELQKMLGEWKENSFRIFICCSSSLSLQFIEKDLQKMDFIPQRVKEGGFLWEECLELQRENPRHIHLFPYPIDASFSLEQDKILFLSEKDLWNKKTSSVSYVKPEDSKDSFESYKKAQSLSFSDIEVNGLVVHTQYGIGRYMGLKEIDLVKGIRAEFIEINYDKDEKLYLPVYKLDQLQKYKGSSHTPLDKLGGQGWKKRKFKVKEKLREIAADLLDLYTRRKKIERPPFKIPSREYFQFSAQFPYTETPEQQQSIQEVLEDMQKFSPMDRLVCGDVGFGKTEVALRACFVVLKNKKQVAIICPTTLLSFQHFQTFKNRFRSWPFQCVCFNRFISPRQIKQNIEDLKSGKASIAIGTHRLLSKDLAFHDLGLLVIDEEHKFGVNHKEKLRQMKIHIDTLALSATPIPRTLNMSLSGIRNLSLIHSPPQNRLPIKTMSVPFQPQTIRRIVKDELARGGQIFFVHNRIYDIQLVAEELKTMLEGIDIRIAIAHGQQVENNLENTMIQFLNKEIDLLISTNIVESGMDLPNVNTLLVHKPQHLGLGQMYQLRGRVGRSSRQGYCYFLLPLQREVSSTLQRRLSILQQHTALGSGITISQYDMELRGAGNFLGKDQSGHLNAVGYELYMDLLKESLSELKGEEPLSAVEPDIAVPLPALIPCEYIEDIRTRLHYYKNLAGAKNQEELEEIQRDLYDQFGKLPEELENLCLLMLIKNQCKRMGIQHLKMGKQNLLLRFGNKDSSFIDKILSLALQRESYQLKPPDQLAIRLEESSWVNIQRELDFLIHRTT